jgi:hypothetical protein
MQLFASLIFTQLFNASGSASTLKHANRLHALSNELTYIHPKDPFIVI